MLGDLDGLGGFAGPQYDIDAGILGDFDLDVQAFEGLESFRRDDQLIVARE